MKKALIFIPLLLALTVYPQQKRKTTTAKPKKPIASKPSASKPVAETIRPDLARPKPLPCYATLLKDTPDVNGVRLGMSFADVSAKLKLTEAKSQDERDKAYVAQTEDATYRVVFRYDLVREIMINHGTKNQFKDPDELSISVSNKLGIPEDWMAFKYSPRYQKAVDDINQEIYKNLDQQMKLAATGNRDEIKALEDKKKKLEQAKEDLDKKVSRFRYRKCFEFDAYALLPEGDSARIMLTVSEK